MFIGIDLGTSAVKIVLVDDDQTVIASADQAFATSRPRPGWSEQDPEIWFNSVAAALDELASQHKTSLAQVSAIGLSGQMHGLVLLDKSDRPVRPAILWNDNRAAQEADELNSAFPELADVVGVRAMPGFTGPKLLWLSRNEAATHAKARRLLFPKDYIRLRLCGTKSTDVSDAAGSWLLDQKRRTWSAKAIRACAAGALELPEILESAAPSGRVEAGLRQRWGLPDGVVVAAGAGDVAAGCAGTGIVDEKRGLVSLGTSAQIVLSTNVYRPQTDLMVHTFCHALPDTWFQMAALLNGASVLEAVTTWTGFESVGAMIAAVKRVHDGPGRLLALPFLSGERTPHNDARIRGAVIGLTHSTTKEQIALAFLEAIAFSLADGLASLVAQNARPEQLALIGGGSRSDFLAQLVSTVLDTSIAKHAGAELGPALGAARLSRLAAGNGNAKATLMPLPIETVFEPDTQLHQMYEERHSEYRALYQALRPRFGEGALRNAESQ